MRSRMAGIGIEPWTGTPEDLRAWQRKEMARYGVIVKAAGIRPE
jgi:hypothetical protein